MRYGVLFRGLNVGGRGKVKMPELEALLLAQGYRNAKTYIQSGNAVLEADVDEATLEMQIHDAFAAQFGFESSVCVRSLPMLEGLIDNLPFSEAQLAAARNADPEVEHLYVYFLPDAPAPEKLDALHGLEAGDTVVAGQREIYLLCAQSVRLSKTAIRLGKAFPTATARNWNTVCKLRDLLSAM